MADDTKYKYTDEFRVDDMVRVLKGAPSPSKAKVAEWRKEEEQVRAKRREVRGGFWTRPKVPA